MGVLWKKQVCWASFPQIVGVLWKKRWMKKYVVGCGCCVDLVKTTAILLNDKRIAVIYEFIL